MKDSIQTYFRHRVELTRALASGRESPVSVNRIVKVAEALKREYGKAGFQRIHQRSIGLVGQVVGGEPAPARLAQMNIDGLAAVEADIIAEQIAAENIHNRATPSRDPSWRETVNRRWHEMIDAAVRSLDRPEAPPVPQQTIEALVEATVTRQIAERDSRSSEEASTRSGEVDRVPSVYMGTYRDDAAYDRGHMVTRNGLLWHCNVNATTEKPGSGPSWTMMHKSHGKDDRHGAAA